MGFTLFVILFFVGLGLLSVFLGHSMNHPELYFLGVLVLLFSGLILLDQGFVRESGYLLDRNETETQNPQNMTDWVINESQSLSFESVKNRWTNALGLLFVVIAGGLAVAYRRNRQEERRQRERSLEVDDKF